MEDLIKTGSPSNDGGSNPSADKGTGSAPAADSSQADKTPPTNGGAEGDGKTPQKTNEGNPSKEPPSPDGSDEEPPSRKSPLDYILERKRQKLEKAKAEKLKSVDDELKSLGVDDEDDISPEDEKLVDKVVDKKYGKHFAAIELQQLNTEIKDFLNNDSLGKHFKDFEDKIRKYAQHPSRAHLPIRSIAFEVAGDKLLKIGAEMAKAAAEEADQSKTGGGTARKPEGKIDYEKMGPKEFEELKEKVKSGEVIIS